MGIPINVELIRTRSADIRQELEILRSCASLPEEKFINDAEKVRSTRYGLVVSVEVAAAICNHLCACRGHAPDSYPGCFESLGTLGIIAGALANRLAAMAQLRNLLVHRYGRVDDRHLHRILREDLGNLEAFVLLISK